MCGRKAIADSELWIRIHNMAYSMAFTEMATIPETVQAQYRLMATTLAERPGMSYNKTPPRLGVWLDYFVAERQDLKRATIQVYQQTGKRLVDHFGAERRIDRIDKVDAAAWHNTLPENLATRAKHARSAKSMFAYAVSLDLIPDNPFKNLRSNAPRKMAEWHYVSERDLHKILAACKTPGWRNFIALMRLGGLRRGEALRLEWGDINADVRTMLVKPEGYEGTKQRLRTVPVVPDLYDILQANHAGERVCDGVGPNNIDRDMRVILKHAGVEPWEKLCHTLRKNLESDWLAKFPPLDVASWLGHSLKVAYDHYHQTTAEVMARATMNCGKDCGK